MRLRFKKESDTTLRTGLAWAFQKSKNSALAIDMEEMIAKERNQQVKCVALYVINLLRGGVREYDENVRRSLKAIYSKDKIVRNEIKDWGDQKNRKSGGRGGRGGRGR